jgi:hypothetical protein
MSETPTDAMQAFGNYPSGTDSAAYSQYLQDKAEEARESKQAVALESPFWATLEGLPSMMKALAQARQNTAYADQLVKGAQELLEATPEYQHRASLQKLRDETSATLMALDAAVRAEALKDFTKNGCKQVFAGIEIKMQTKVEVFTDRVKDWAIKHMPNLLVLDMKAVEKIAKTGTMDAELVRVYKEPQVNIDKDLTCYLQENAPALDNSAGE